MLHVSVGGLLFRWGASFLSGGCAPWGASVLMGRGGGRGSKKVVGWGAPPTVGNPDKYWQFVIFEHFGACPEVRDNIQSK